MVDEDLVIAVDLLIANAKRARRDLGYIVKDAARIRAVRSAIGSFVQEQSPGGQLAHGVGCALLVDVSPYRSDVAFRTGCPTGE